MNGFGLLQLEAVICFAAFLAVLALFLSVLNQASLDAENAVGLLGEKARAEKCCIFVDAAYTAGISSFFGEVPCDAENGRAKIGGKLSDCLATDIRLVQRNGESVLELGLNGHYR
jgi:hypothetical protein